MKRPSRSSLPGLFVLVATLGACQQHPAAPVCPPAELAPQPEAGRSDRDREYERTQAKLDLLLVKVEGLEKKIAAGKAAAPPPRRGPDPQAVYAVDISGDPFIGPADAKVTIVKASEYACPFCLKVEPTLEQLLKDYPGQVRIVYKDYIVHPDRATVPAHAACAAHVQGRFADFNRALWDRAFGVDTSERMMVTLATDLKLNVDKFAADLYSAQCADGVVNDQKILSAVGVTGTPAFFINGRFLSGARPIEMFKPIIDEELQKAKLQIGKDGVTASNYYDKVVFAKGQKSL